MIYREKNMTEYFKWKLFVSQVDDTFIKVLCLVTEPTLQNRQSTLGVKSANLTQVSSMEKIYKSEEEIASFPRLTMPRKLECGILSHHSHRGPLYTRTIVSCIIACIRGANAGATQDTERRGRKTRARIQAKPYVYQFETKELRQPHSKISLSIFE